MAKIAFVSNREHAQTFFTLQDDFAWNAITTAIWKELSQEKWRKHTLLIPIYSRFDRYVLWCAERLGIAVEFYIPSQKWGETAIPQNQIALVQRMKARYPVHVVPGNTKRLNRMMAMCDGAFVLQSQDFVDFDPSTVDGKRVHVFDFPKAAAAYAEQLKTPVQA